MKLSVIIPVFNEEKTILEILKKVGEVKLSNNLTKEIIVVDDGSTDSSKFKVLALRSGQNSKLFRKVKLITHKTNLGKGAAARTGIKNSTGDLIIIQDADLEYDPNDYIKLMDPILKNKAQVVYGTRLKNYPLNMWGENKTVLPVHLIANRFLTFLTNLLFGANLTDMETCYKLFNANILKNIKLEARGFDFEPEVTAKILKQGIKITEVSIKTKPRGYNQGKKIGWIDGLIAIWTLIKYRFVD